MWLLHLWFWMFWLLIVGCMVDDYCSCSSYIAVVVDVAVMVIEYGSFGCWLLILYWSKDYCCCGGLVLLVPLQSFIAVARQGKGQWQQHKSAVVAGLAAVACWKWWQHLQSWQQKPGKKNRQNWLHLAGSLLQCSGGLISNKCHCKSNTITATKWWKLGWMGCGL